MPTARFYVERSVFVGLYGTQRGGAIRIEIEIDQTVVNCLFVKCSCSEHGGAAFFLKGNLYLNKNCFIQNSASRTADVIGSQCTILNYSLISCTQAQQIEHALWAGSFQYFSFKNINSTYSVTTSNAYTYGAFFTFSVPANNILRYFQSSNSSGSSALFMSESSSPPNAEFGNLLYDSSSTAIFGSFRLSTSISNFHHIFVFGNKKIVTGYANYHSSSTLCATDCTFDLPETFFRSMQTNNCVFSNKVENNMMSLQTRVICEELIASSLCKSSCLNNINFFCLNNLFNFGCYIILIS